MKKPKRKARLLRRAHPYIPSAATPQQCAACPLPEANQVHHPENIRLEAERRAAYGRRYAGSEDS